MRTCNLDDAERDKLGGSCQKYLETNSSSKVKGWIRGTTKIGPALEVVVAHHQGRYGIDFMIQSFLKDELVPGS